MSQATSRKRSILSRIVRRIIWVIYRLQGWKIESGLPDIPKFVIAGAPHTSNWDFVFFTGATAEEGVEPSFMGKHTLFQGMMRNFMFDMGGVPVDRTKRANYVEQVADAFAAADKLALVIAAEGTRSSNGEWRSGFYHIAQAANVPIVVAWVSWKDRKLGFSDPIYPTGNYPRDLMTIAEYLLETRPDYPRYNVLEAQALRLIEEGEAR